MQKTVLIVEDDYLIAMDLKSLLERHGWRIMGPAPTIQEALRLLAAELPSAALLDVNLRDQLVTPVAEFLKAQDVPFALVSAYMGPERFTSTVLAGALNIGKPIGEKRLMAALAELTGS